MAVPELSLYVGTTEVGKVPYGENVNVLNWNVDETWASMEFNGVSGYADKSRLELMQENTPITDNPYSNSFTFSTASDNAARNQPYIVIQVTLKEKFWGTGSGNLIDLENTINDYFSRGYRLHSMSTSSANSVGGLGGDRIQATLVFERINLLE